MAIGEPFATRIDRTATFDIVRPLFRRYGRQRHWSIEVRAIYCLDGIPTTMRMRIAGTPA